MLRTTVVFVHGFISDPRCWDPFVKRLEKDPDFLANAYRFVRFQYPTKFIEWNPSKRIPDVDECGNALDDFLGRLPAFDQLFLVGHSMGGLVIQSYIADKIKAQRGTDLAKIRSVILFATPNRGATILSSLRGIIAKFRKNSQDVDLTVWDKDIAEMSDIITRSVLAAKTVDRGCCPIPFRAFWGLQDDVVPEVSARGSFVEASGLPGGHSEILECDPVESDDQRYPALKSALLEPVGHPFIYEIDLFEVGLAVAPVEPPRIFTLSGDVRPLTIEADNWAIRSIKIVLSRQNRCTMPYEQFYRSDKGMVELLSLTQPNDAPDEVKSRYYETGKEFSYIFTPDREGTFSIKLRIYNGFGAGQRSWHNHMKPNARYRLFRFNLDLKAYRDAGFQISQEPSMFYYPQNIMDHNLCANRVGETPLPPLPSGEPWLRSWEIPTITGGVVDLAWDVKKPA